MLFTFFPPLRPLPDQALDNTAYAAAHCRQTTPRGVHDLDLAQLFDTLVNSARVGRKGDAGYIIAGDCTTTRKEGGAAGFVLIDYDDRPEGPDWELLDEYEGFAWTTAAGHPHWRVLIPLEEAFRHGKLNCPFPGGHIRNRTQPAFLPTHASDLDQIQWRALEGTKRLDGKALGHEATEYRVERQSMLGSLFQAVGWVEGEQHDALIVKCPWQHEHTGGKAGGTVCFHDDPEHTGMGKFSCAHGHCDGRTSFDALEVLKALPAAQAELKHWPEPDMLSPYQRVDEVEPEDTIYVMELPKARVGGCLVKVHAGELAQPLGEIPWLVEGIDFAPGRPMVVAGKAGSGKTYALQEMALSVAGGGMVWGEFPVNRTGPVLHIDVDQGRYATSMRYQLLARGRGLDLASLPISCAFFDFAMSNKRGIDPEAIQALANAVQGHALCIIDSLRGIAPGLDEQDSAFGDVLQALTQVSTITGCAFAVVAHSGHDQNRARGTSAIQDRAGSVYQLERVQEAGGEGHVSWEQQKVSEYSKGAPVRFKTVMDRTPSGLNDQTTIRVPAELRTGEDPATTIQRCMLEELERAAAKGLKQADLLHAAARIQKRKEFKLDCLRDLETKKSIVRLGVGQGARYVLGTHLPGPGPESGTGSMGTR